MRPAFLFSDRQNNNFLQFFILKTESFTLMCFYCLTKIFYSRENCWFQRVQFSKRMNNRLLKTMIFQNIINSLSLINETSRKISWHLFHDAIHIKMKINTYTFISLLNIFPNSFQKFINMIGIGIEIHNIFLLIFEVLEFLNILLYLMRRIFNLCFRILV